MNINALQKTKLKTTSHWKHEAVARKGKNSDKLWVREVQRPQERRVWVPHSPSWSPVLLLSATPALSVPAMASKEEQRVYSMYSLKRKNHIPKLGLYITHCRGRHASAAAWELRIRHRAPGVKSHLHSQLQLPAHGYVWVFTAWFSLAQTQAVNQYMGELCLSLFQTN